MATIYIETSVASYLTARPSAEIVAQSRQILTKKWWGRRRHDHQLFTSEFVLDESARGDAALARERIKALEGIPLLAILPEAFVLAEDLLSQSILPAKAHLDALHISLAAVHEIEYLLTWNCRHIANAQILPAVYRAIELHGYAAPFICTIEEMLGDDESFT